MNGTSELNDLMDKSFSQHINNVKNVFSGIYQDLKNTGFHWYIFTEQKRAFYLGVILITLFVIYLLVKGISKV